MSDRIEKAGRSTDDLVTRLRVPSRHQVDLTRYVVFVAALALGCSFVPDLAHRWLIVTVLALTSMVPLAVQAWLPPRLASVVWHFLLFGVIGLLAALVPSVAAPALVASTGVLIFASLSLPIRSLPFAMAAALLPAVVAWRADLAGWAPLGLTAVIVCAGFMRYAVDYQVRVGDLEAQLSTVLSSADVAINEVEIGNATIASIAGPVERMTGWSELDWTQQDHRELIHPDDLESYWIDADSVIDGQRFDRTARFRRPDGSFSWLREISQVRRRSDGTFVLTGILTDVTAASEALQSARHSARHDQLTGLANRASLTAELTTRLERDEAIGLLILDIDTFKSINDTLGHAAGDRVLVEVANRLRSVTAATNFVARLGGDEFAMIVSGSDPGAMSVAREVHTRLDEPVALGDLVVAAKASIGLIQSNRYPVDGETLMRWADIAMYEAKRQGGGVCEFDSELEISSVEDLMLAGDVAAGLERGEFVAHFQPQVDLRSGRVIGAEALARWQHPVLGLLSAERFIDLMRLSSRFEAFTTTMLEQALAAQVACRRVNPAVQMSVNVAVRSLHDRSLVEWLVERSRQMGLEPSSLTIELTESEMMDTAGDAARSLAALSAQGFRISIDDFGTGYSSLAALAGIRLDEMKLDRAFIQQARASSHARGTIEALTSMAHQLRSRVVAEGIESVEDATLVRHVGCDVGQGYLYGGAIPLHELLDLLTRTPDQPTPRAAGVAAIPR